MTRNKLVFMLNGQLFNATVCHQRIMYIQCDDDSEPLVVVNHWNNSIKTPRIPMVSKDEQLNGEDNAHVIAKSGQDRDHVIC